MSGPQKSGLDQLKDFLLKNGPQLLPKFLSSDNFEQDKRIFESLIEPDSNVTVDFDSAQIYLKETEGKCFMPGDKNKADEFSIPDLIGKSRSNSCASSYPFLREKSKIVFEGACVNYFYRRRDTLVWGNCVYFQQRFPAPSAKDFALLQDGYRIADDMNYISALCEANEFDVNAQRQSNVNWKKLVKNNPIFFSKSKDVVHYKKKAITMFERSANGDLLPSARCHHTQSVKTVSEHLAASYLLSKLRNERGGKAKLKKLHSFLKNPTAPAQLAASNLSTEDDLKSFLENKYNDVVFFETTGDTVSVRLLRNTEWDKLCIDVVNKKKENIELRAQQAEIQERAGSSDNKNEEDLEQGYFVRVEAKKAAKHSPKKSANKKPTTVKKTQKDYTRTSIERPRNQRVYNSQPKRYGPIAPQQKSDADYKKSTPKPRRGSLAWKDRQYFKKFKNKTHQQPPPIEMKSFPDYVPRTAKKSQVSQKPSPGKPVAPYQGSIKPLSMPSTSNCFPPTGRKNDTNEPQLNTHLPTSTTSLSGVRSNNLRLYAPNQSTSSKAIPDHASSFRSVSPRNGLSFPSTSQPSMKPQPKCNNTHSRKPKQESKKPPPNGFRIPQGQGDDYKQPIIPVTDELQNLRKQQILAEVEGSAKKNEKSIGMPSTSNVLRQSKPSRHSSLTQTPLLDCQVNPKLSAKSVAVSPPARTDETDIGAPTQTSVNELDKKEILKIELGKQPKTHANVLFLRCQQRCNLYRSIQSLHEDVSNNKENKFAVENCWVSLEKGI